jgi:hypothetical protein
VKIESLDRNVQQVLSTGYYRIPRFQRPYSWADENLEEFWTDTIVDATSDYFIGAVIVFETSSNRFDVVDGQQRLTTLTIMLAALRDTFDGATLPKLALGLHAFVERPNVGFDPEYVLQTETSYPFFHEHIQKHGSPDHASPSVSAEEAALQRAKTFFTKKFTEMVESVQIDPRIKLEDRAPQVEAALAGIRDKLLRLKLILVTVDDEDDAYTIFETLNSRGMNLTVSDLLKNHIFRHMRKRNARVDIPRAKWESIHDIFNSSSAHIDMDSFIHHQWLSTHEYVSGPKLFRHIKKAVTKSQAPTYLDALVSDSHCYRTIKEPEWTTWASGHREIRDSLRALNLFGVDQPIPFVLAVLRALQAKIIKAPLAKRALRAVENYHFIFTAVTGTSSSGGITKMYASHAREMSNSRDSQTAALSVDALINKLRIPSEDVFVASFVELGYSATSSKQKRLVRYVMDRVYLHNCTGSVPDLEQMTIEHILPESPPPGVQHSPEDVANIGNLILVDEKLNDKLGNRPFAEKQVTLAAAGQVWIDPLVLSATTWDGAVIGARADAIARLAYTTIWKT